MLFLTDTGEVGIDSKDLNYFVNICNFFGVKSFLNTDSALNEIQLKDCQNGVVYEEDLIEFDDKTDMILEEEQFSEPTAIENPEFSTTTIQGKAEIYNTDQVSSQIVAETIHTKIPSLPPQAPPSINNTAKGSSLNIKKSKVNEIVINKAIEELKAGKSLRDVTLKYKIPRSTLYFRAKQQLVNLKKRSQGLSRYSYLNEAIKCVKRGQMSYQQAEHQFNIPKSIIWRNLKKFDQNPENISPPPAPLSSPAPPPLPPPMSSPAEPPLQKKSTNCDSVTSEIRLPPEDKEVTDVAAVLANKLPKKSTKCSKAMAITELEMGKTLSEVSKKYDIPISTLYREKKKLYLAGKLPQTSSPKTYRSGEDFKEKVRLAVEACQKGVSQGIASCLYNVPKTTIWRHLKQLNKNQSGNKS